MAVIDQDEDRRSDGGEVVLAGVLTEFRQALRDEIDAAKRNASSSAVPLVNGRRIGAVGSGFQYVFAIENALNLPGDAPGDLLIPGRSPLEAMVISVEGLSITVSVSVDLGPFVATARLQSNLTMLMRELIKRIEALADKPNPGGDRLLAVGPVAGSPQVPARPSTLNAGQRAAVASVLGRDTTFIWGPPGTGKTSTIGTIGAELFDRGQSLLIVSHTNTAVDQALYKVGKELAETDPGALAAGAVIRVGDPSDKRLAEWEDLLLKTHVDRRSTELTARREALEAEQTRLVQLVLDLSRLIAIVEWAAEAGPDIAATRAELAAVTAVEDQAAVARSAAAHADEELRNGADLVTAAENAASAEREVTDVRARYLELSRDARRVAARLQEAATAAAAAAELLITAQSIEPTRRRLAQLGALDEQRATAAELHAQAASFDARAASTEAAREEAVAVLAQVRSTGGLARRWKGLPNETEQAAIAERTTAEATAARDTAERASMAAADATSMLTELEELHRKLAGHGTVPPLAEQRTRKTRADSELTAAQKKQAATVEESARLAGRTAELTAIVRSFETAHGRPPDDVLNERDRLKVVATDEGTRAKRLTKDARARRTDLEALLRERLALLRDWALTRQAPGAAESMQSDVEAAHERALEEAAGRDVGALTRERSSHNESIRRVEAEIDTIDDQLKRIEEVVIADATVVATTLTRAYLRDSIQARRFDTVLLDEASMAPIPALWVAASLADRAVVAVGDFLQLPPICIADKSDLAKRWLGRDIFEVAGTNTVSEGPAHLMRLTEQYRMHPDVSYIANELLYGGQLIDNEQVQTDGNLREIYDIDWGHDSPVLLVDTSSTGAWVTSVARGDSASRLNFLSATICLDLVEQILRADRPTHVPGSSARVLLVSPYKPHATLLNLLVAEHGLTGEVLAGTVHTFQGSEAEIVIVDLVNDEPHWKVGLFMEKADEQNRRLFNVAITRAKHRLIIVGDLDYNQKNSKKAFLGKRLLPLLRDRYPVVDALDIVPAGLAARVVAGQSAMLGGEVEPDSDRVVITQEHFFPMFAGDLGRARRRVVIYSAFMTANRLGFLEPQLRAAVARGIEIYVVTRTFEDLKKFERPEYEHLARALTEWGAVVIHKKNMHEKVVFVDDHILWTGSLNPLSFSNTQEVMERRDNAKVAQDYARVLRLDDLVGAFASGTPTCPICESEMHAAEGNKEPFYWKCPQEGCYTRSIDEPVITGGVIVCKACGGDVEFGEWGDEPHWRCVENRKHRQRVARTHLRLPKMRADIPKADLTTLDKRWGTTPTTLF